MSADSLLFDTKKAAEMLSVSPDFLERLRVDGGGPRFKKFLGRGRGRYGIVRYTRQALEDWINQQAEYANTSEATRL